jgi:acetolactate synthase I/II/III large subunit
MNIPQLDSDTEARSGASVVLTTARDAGVDVCFANPGTTEMPFVGALDTVAGVRSILGLFEGVCTGAADGYGRMTGKPAMTLLHLGPGHANGIANLHNARRARTPILNIVGDHTREHLKYDAPLTSDIESLARPVSVWYRSVARDTDLATDTADAISAAMGAQRR